MFVYKTKVYILIAFIYYSERVQNHRCWGFPDSMHSSRRFFFYVAPFKKSLCKIGLAEISNIEFAKTREDFFFIIPAIFCQNEFAISTRFSIWVGNPKNILRKNNFEKEYSTLKYVL